MQDTDNDTVAELRARELGRAFTLGELRDALEKSATFDAFRKEHILEDVTVRDLIRIMQESDSLQELRNYDIGLSSRFTLGDLLQTILDTDHQGIIVDRKVISMATVEDVLEAMDAKGLAEKYSDVELGGTITVGEAIDLLAGNADIQARRDTAFTVKTTLGKLLDLVGEEKVKNFLEEKAAEASYTADYESTAENVILYWMHLILFIIIFSLLAVITLEFIDKDKR